MTILLVVEDGSGLVNSNTYIDLAYMTNMAEQMGWGLPATDEEVKSLLLQAMPFIESQKYQGIKASPTQALKWPRSGVRSDGYDIPSNVIPEDIKKAQAQAAWLTSEGVELLSVGNTTGPVTEETVGPITTKYSDKYPQFGSYFGALSNYLNSYLFTVDGGYKLSPWFGF